jgi:hypothetical protein
LNRSGKPITVRSPTEADGLVSCEPREALVAVSQSCFNEAGRFVCEPHGVLDESTIDGRRIALYPQQAVAFGCAHILRHLRRSPDEKFCPREKTFSYSAQES